MHILAFDSGATRTRAGLYDEAGKLAAEAEGEPANPAAYGLSAAIGALAGLGRALTREVEGPVAGAAGVAGALDPKLQVNLARGLCEALGLSRALVATDLHPVLYANVKDGGGLLAIAGTGAAVLGKTASGRMAHLGGRGHVFGDEGSAYHIAVAAMRAAAQAMDGTGPETGLTEVLLKASGVRHFAALGPWSLAVPKSEIAALAQAAAEAAEAGDFIARSCIEDQARRLAGLALAAQERLGLPFDAQVYVHGGLFKHCAIYREAFEEALEAYTDLRVAVPPLEGHAAVHAMAMMAETPPKVSVYEGRAGEARMLPPTERQSFHEETLDQLDAAGIAHRMNHEDAEIAAAVGREKVAIAALIDVAGKSIRAGGRILHVGAGTSGRLGVLDASECPPTFGVSPDRVVGIIAGGERALRHSVEGAEDDCEQAVDDLEELNVEPRDTVIGIASSGTTPYVLAALRAAKEKGAVTGLVACNPDCPRIADITVAIDTGPEVLTGSTRLKAGTATKMVLNMITTGAMALAGYVYQGLMAGMAPANAKLRERAARIVAAISEIDESEAQTLLEQADYSISTALVMAKRGVNREKAEQILLDAGGVVRDALEPPSR